ncbi:hypothetical protein [Halostreptopolyspora alba]|uniref:Uncharacterized protein n=1 Tax=Halostreptopolyspora alba TaxID=2487137 RepID=A0A3N0EB07_9ACTN|nr:hypothetical protein EFW17_09760 [Nocardiopsaceae bacterium YIM 96095]
MPRGELETPDTEAAWAQLSEWELAAIREVDQDRLRVERSRVAAWVAERITEPTSSTWNRFRDWERLTRRMMRAWAPDGYYVIEEYINDLEIRDALEDVVGSLDSDTLRGLLTVLDERFIAHTVADGGDELRPHYRYLRSGAELSWIWYRRPISLPWWHTSHSR